MVYDRNSRGGNFEYGRDYGDGRDYSYTSARDYEAAREGGGRGPDRGGYGRQDQGRGGYGRGGGDYGRGGYGASGYGRGEQGRYEGGGYGGGYEGGRGGYDRGQDRSDYGARDYGNQRYGGGERFDAGRDKADYYRSGERGRYGAGDRGGYGRQPQGYDYEERGFFDRAGDEVRSWFGDEEAERRREADQRYDERGDRGAGQGGRSDRDHDYHNWRSSQMAALDRDYDDYRRENRSRFEQEFSTWRTMRQGQRDQLKQVKEHAEVVGSDGQHVGTVDKVKGDRILLTKNDQDAGGKHHSIPSNWVTSVDDKVTLNKSAAEAKQAWEDEDGSSAMFGYGDNARGTRNDRDDASGSGRNLNKSFSGTY